MIEDKKLGAKAAESAEEALWTKVKEAREKTISQMEEALKVEKVFLEAAKKKLSEIQKK